MTFKNFNCIMNICIYISKYIYSSCNTLIMIKLLWRDGLSKPNEVPPVDSILEVHKLYINVQLGMKSIC